MDRVFLRLCLLSSDEKRILLKSVDEKATVFPQIFWDVDTENEDVDNIKKYLEKILHLSNFNYNFTYKLINLFDETYDDDFNSDSEYDYNRYPIYILRVILEDDGLLNNINKYDYTLKLKQNKEEIKIYQRFLDISTILKQCNDKKRIIKENDIKFYISYILCNGIEWFIIINGRVPAKKEKIKLKLTQMYKNFKNDKTKTLMDLGIVGLYTGLASTMIYNILSGMK